MEKPTQLEWILGDEHPIYGEVIMMGTIGGESIRWFFKDGVTSMIPLDVLNYGQEGNV